MAPKRPPSPARSGTDIFDEMKVDTAGDWTGFITSLPDGMEVLGTIRLKDSQEGALLHSKTMGYYLTNRNTSLRLDGYKVSSLLGIMGRDPKVKKGERKNVYLDAATIEKATLLGKGNFSEGIRLAVAYMPLSALGESDPT